MNQKILKKLPEYPKGLVPLKSSLVTKRHQNDHESARRVFLKRENRFQAPQLIHFQDQGFLFSGSKWDLQLLPSLFPQTLGESLICLSVMELGDKGGADQKFVAK